jgi:hypothetical protein
MATREEIIAQEEAHQIGHKKAVHLLKYAEPSAPGIVEEIFGAPNKKEPVPEGSRELVAGGHTIRAWDLNTGKSLVVEGKIDAGRVIDIYVKL